jgi:hypothetical protein
MASRQEMEAIARSWVEAYNDKDYERLADLLAPELVLEDVGMGLLLNRRLTFDRIHVDGDTVICEGGWSGTFLVEKWGNPPGTKHSHRSCTILRTRDGCITSFTDYTCGDKNEPATNPVETV